jgi:hypothetical protein
MCNNIEILMFIVIGILILVLIYVNKDKIFSGFENNTTSATNVSELDENGFVKGELKPSYWYNYSPSDTRSKCFACDAESNYRHPSNCIDCEMKGGRPVDKLLNRVLTR